MVTIYRHWFPCTITPEIPHGKGYTGRTYRTVEERDKERFKPSAVTDSVSLKDAIVEYGKENMQTDEIETDILSIKEVVNEREIYWIAYFDDYYNGYNRDKGGTGFDPETASESARKRIADGTHNFLGSENNRKRVEDGTHPFLGGEQQRRRVKDGTHHLLGGEMQRKQVADGTHHLLGGEIVRKRVDDGTHNFLAKNRCPESEKRRIESSRRPEYTQARVFFFLEIAPMQATLKEKCKHFRQALKQIPRRTLYTWFRKWQKELDSHDTR